MSAVITHVHCCRAAPSTVAVLPLRSPPPHACRHRSATALAVAPSCSRLHARAATLATPRLRRHVRLVPSRPSSSCRRRCVRHRRVLTPPRNRRCRCAATLAPPLSATVPSAITPPVAVSVSSATVLSGAVPPRPSLSRPPPFRPRPSRVRPTCGRPGPVLPQLARQRRAGRPRAAVPALHVRLPGHDAPALYVQPRRPSTCG